ncbi:MAG: hypothetical protein KJZ84_20060 [Bryobacteraceae bacterium]|nr:hypothetical protein [Bryobacteraceae bacterium]
MRASTVNAAGRRLLFAGQVLCLFLAAGPAHPQSNIRTMAGNGSQVFSGDGGPATAAGLHHPRGLAVDASGNVYISDVDNHRIRRVSPGGIISTIAGNGVPGDSGDGGLAVSASLSDVTGLTLDGAGNLYIADAGNRRIRKVTPNGIISTIAGTGIQGFSGDGGPATDAQLNRPTSVLFWAGSLYIADSSNQRIRRVSANGTITTIAGNGVAGFSGDGGPATGASLRFPLGLAADGLGNLYFADGDNNRVRRISPEGIITTAAGNGSGRFAGDQGPATSASLNIPWDVTIDGAGNLYIADAGNNRVRRVDGFGLISTLTGTGADGYAGDGGPAADAVLNFPWGLTTDPSGRIYIADRVNNRVRLVSGSPAGVPVLEENSTVNSASFAAVLAPGGIVTLLGSGFSGSTLSASTIPLPTLLGETSVTFNGIPAPLFFVSDTRIQAQAPFELSADSDVSVQVRRGNSLSASRMVSVSAVSPGIFIVDPASSAGAVLHAEDFSLVSSEAPARPGESLLIYSTGLGPMRVAVASGESAPSDPALTETLHFPSVTIAGSSANVIYSGLVPGFVGLYQIEVQAPPGMPAGAQPVQITMLGATSNIATIAVTR